MTGTSQLVTTAAGDVLSSQKVVHVAIPVRWSLVAPDGRGPVETACTYDIHPHGARLIGTRPVRVGDLVQIERGRNRALCQVVWTAEPDSPLGGQFSVQCVEGKAPWEEELNQAEEKYAPLIANAWQRRDFLRHTDNRRRRPRYSVEGTADLSDGLQRVEGSVQQLSELGARLSTQHSLPLGTDLRLTLNVLDVNVGLKARVKNLFDSDGMGVEFQQIRRGDRPMLDYVLRRLKATRIEEFIKVEVVTEPMAAAAG
ncbi:MAG TPA: PilZ domain-containing protein [Candidatus Sulfotelmatobacter sp.]|nr:PilZ domain-containing protein [Candidatus Sulfotelmatobacter sp.]